MSEIIDLLIQQTDTINALLLMGIIAYLARIESELKRRITRLESILLERVEIGGNDES